MIEGVFLGRFLLFGLVAWVAAIVMGTGAFFRLWKWRDQWPLAGALAGAGTFALYVSAYSITTSLIAPVGGLFVGCGIAMAYGTRFLRPILPRPRLEPGSAEERLWLTDASDRLRPQPLDWVVTSSLLVPGGWLAWMGVQHLFTTPPIVIGLLSCLGPAFAAVGLALRGRESRRLADELEELDGLEEATPVAALDEGVG